MNSYVPRPAKPLAGPQGNPVGQPYGSDALHRLSLGKSTGADTSTDALGRAMFRANQNRKNFGVVRPTKKDTTPIGGLKPSPASQGATMGGMPKYKDPTVVHGSH